MPGGTTNGILKGISVCTQCTKIPKSVGSALPYRESPFHPQGIPLKTLNGTYALGQEVQGVQRRPPQTPWPGKISVNISREEQQERYEKTISMVVLIMYALMEQREEEVPATRG